MTADPPATAPLVGAAARAGEDRRADHSASADHGLTGALPRPLHPSTAALLRNPEWVAKAGAVLAAYLTAKHTAEGVAS